MNEQIGDVGAAFAETPERFERLIPAPGNQHSSI